MDALRNYRHVMFWSEEDHEYVATCPAFGPGTNALAATPEQALVELGIALNMTLETYAEEGWDLPPPDAVPATYSGKFVVRVPKTLHQKLAEQAEADGVSLNALVTSALAEAVGHHRAPKPA